MIVKRDLTKTLKRFTKFPAIGLLGPRQSGKKTLVKGFFKQHSYFTLEDPETLAYVTEDPKRFLREYENSHGIIIDEFQHAPALLSYLQNEIDEKDRPGYFVLTGSQNFLMNQAITQSLAGRIGILNLLPLSIHELEHNKLLPDLDSLILQGGFPRIHVKGITPQDLLPSYISTYLERDVRQLLNVGDLITFQKFMKLCAGRVGQQLNLLDLATNCGINQKTADKWLSVLETSYIIFLLKPHYKNFNKRITKTPKLYFYDTGLVCSLLGIRSVSDVSASPFRGALFECLIMSDFYKQYDNLGIQPPLYYWRDQNGRMEIDCLIDVSANIIPVEIKSGETITDDYFNSLKKWGELTGIDAGNGYIVYGGSMKQSRSKGTVISWVAAGELVGKLEKVT